MALVEDLLFCLKPRCPSCRKGRLFKPHSLDVVPQCAECGAALGTNDVGDGASVFLIFVAGFTIAPPTFLVQHFLAPPTWLLLSGATLAVIALTVALMPVVKAYIMLLEFRHLRKKAP